MLALFLNSTSSFFWPVIGAGVGVYLFYHGFQLLQRKRLIENTPSSKIRSAAMGLVELNGLACGPYTLQAPITGVPCFYYRTLVWQWKQAGRSKSWVKVADEHYHVPFYLDDGTGHMLVNPQGAELDIHRDFYDEFSTSLFSSSLQTPANITNFLTMHGIPTDNKIKVEEYCIKPKNALFVLGTLAQNNGTNVGAAPIRSISSIGRVSWNFANVTWESSVSVFVPKREATEQVVAYHPPLDPAQREKVIAALTKAGINSPAAWAAAGIGPTAPVAPVVVANSNGAAAAPATEFDLHPHTVLMKGKQNPAFYISWRSQREVLASLRWKSTAMIWGGPALTLLCMYVLAAQYGWL